MKYRILLLLSFISTTAFSQSIMPSVDYLSFEVTGIQFNTHTSTTTHYPYDSIRYEFSTGEYLANNSFGISNASGKVVGEAVQFYSNYYWEYEYNRYREEKSVEIEIDTVNQLITRLRYQYKYSRIVYNNHPNDESKSFDIELRDIPYVQYGDTIVYSADRDLLQKYSHAISYGGSSKTRYTYSITYGKFKDLLPNASLTGKFVKLKTNSSFFTSNFYNIAMEPDIKLRRYYTDSIAVHYRNDYSDTVTIQQISCIDNAIRDQTITYADGKPLTAKHVILPYTKDHKIYLAYTSFQGPLSVDNTLAFTIHKIIKGITFLDTIVLVVSLKDVDYEPYIMIDTTVPDHQLLFELNAGDATQRSIRIDYTKDIEGTNFPSIPDTTGFSLAQIDHGSNTKNIEFMFTSDTPGVFNYEYYFNYIVKDFRGRTHYKQYSKPLILSAEVRTLQSVRILPDTHEFQVFPNPASNGFNFIVPNVSSREIDVSIYDVLGNEIIEHSVLNNADGYHFDFPKTLVDGSYFIVVRAANQIITSKLVIDR